MRYAKLTNGYPRYAPNPLTMGGMTVANPTEEMLREAGYLTVVTSEPPQTDDRHYPVSAWQERGGQIIQTWAIEEIPLEERPTDLEARVAQLEAERADMIAAYEEGVNNG